jgi:hypothetical protein
MDPIVTAAISLPWWKKWLLKRAVKLILKKLNKAGRARFTRGLAFEIRQQIVQGIMGLIEEAKARTPDFTVDEDALQCAAWVFESDTIQREVNKKTGEHMDVHAKWSTNYTKPTYPAH